jgi:hypothetical protein
VAWPPGGAGQAREFVAVFTDDGEVVDCVIDSRPG